MADNQIRFTMLDSAEHSFLIGLQSLREGLEGTEKGNPNKFKESVVWVCHAIELFLKQLLAQHDPLFVLADPDKAIKELMKLRSKAEDRNIGFVSLLDPELNIFTAGYSELVERVANLLVIPTLQQSPKTLQQSPKKPKSVPLRGQIDELILIRNKIMHSTFLIDVEEVSSLILEIVEPFMLLMQAELDPPMRYGFTMQMAFQIRNGKDRLTLYKPDVPDNESRVLNLVRQFHKQSVPVTLFGLNQEGELELPNFDGVKIAPAPISHTYFAQSQESAWIIYIAAGGYANKETMVDIMSWHKRYPSTTLWAVADTGFYSYSRLGIFVTTRNQLDELEQFIKSPI